jgi:ribosomal protein L7Ae-like RNA K-turn-binding protein
MAVRDALARRKAHLVVLAGDAGRSTAGSLTHLATNANCPVATVSTKSELGRALGLGPTAVIAILDINLTKGLRLALADPGSAANTGVDE